MNMLPIDEVLPALLRALVAHPAAVLQAPPGAGKTTRVPLALLGEPWLRGQRIIMLEPRRLAARNAAGWMSKLLDEEVGQTVGYRTRMDTQVSARTRIEVVTEGVLARMLQSDPALEGVGCVIFDEFHERSIHSDVGLALCLDAQRTLREDLRVLVMSATLDAAPVAQLLGNAPLITSAGRSFPVDIHFLGGVNPQHGVETAVVNAILRALSEESGSVLVFLPGAGEIRRVEERLRAGSLPNDVLIAPLYGDLARGAQDQAIRPCAPAERKVVLATSIAETSLTIEGVRVVIDSGLRRVPRFEPRSGMTRLDTVRVSQASATQRCGRAGRMEPGVCYRLWSAEQHKGLAPFNTPEIADADLAPLALELAQWGVRDINALAWLDAPPAAALAQARDLLTQLGALDRNGRIVAHGRDMAVLALHPRLAHMVLKARELGWGAVACELAALLSERDILKTSTARRDTDMRTRLDLLHGKGAYEERLDRAACRQVKQAAEQWQRRLRVDAQGADTDHAGVLLAFAYPDRLAQRRSESGYRYLLANGRGALLPEGDALAKAPYLVAAHLDAGEREARIFLAAPLREEELEKYFSDSIAGDDRISWNSREQAVMARRQRRYGELILRDAPLINPDPEQVVRALLQGIRETGMELLPWTKDARNWQARVDFVRRAFVERAAQWPDVSDANLFATLEHWLAPALTGITRMADVGRVDLLQALSAGVEWKQRKALDELAPTHIVVPSGSRVPLDYVAGDVPVLAVRLQEMFGLSDTPCIADGRVGVMLHLLSPARHPVQITRDLAGFWANTYRAVKKDLQGRYPKHYWPDDPLRAEPTHRAKPRRS